MGFWTNIGMERRVGGRLKEAVKDSEAPNRHRVGQLPRWLLALAWNKERPIWRKGREVASLTASFPRTSRLWMIMTISRRMPQHTSASRVTSWSLTETKAQDPSQSLDVEETTLNEPQGMKGRYSREAFQLRLTGPPVASSRPRLQLRHRACTAGESRYHCCSTEKI